MAEIHVSIQGDKELQAKINKFGIEILDLSEGMDDIGRYLRRFFSGEVFASRGRVINKPWPDLNPSYAAWKARAWPGRPPLMRTGQMNVGFKYSARRLSVRLFNDVPYFDAHQEGIGVPQRVMMAVDERRERGVVRLLQDDLNRIQKEADV